MWGAIAGDIIGSPFEGERLASPGFRLFSPASRATDDTVLTIAIAEALLGDRDYRRALHSWGRRYPAAGFGRSFRSWLIVPVEAAQPYGSLGNGSAMRVSPVGWLARTEDEVLVEAERTALPTHNHPEGVKGAQAVALAVFKARHGASKSEIKRAIESRFGYDLDRSLAAIRKRYHFDVTCQGSVPEALIAFLESGSWEDAVRNAVLLNGDTDTQACIAGAVAEAFYGEVPRRVRAAVVRRLPAEMVEVMKAFESRLDAGAGGDVTPPP